MPDGSQPWYRRLPGSERARGVVRWVMLSGGVAAILGFMGWQCPHCGAPVVVCRNGILAMLAMGVGSSTVLLAVRGAFERLKRRVRGSGAHDDEAPAGDASIDEAPAGGDEPARS